VPDACDLTAFKNQLPCQHLAVVVVDPFVPYPGAGYIDFDYSRSAADDDGGAADARHNWRMELHFWCRS
jgi:hypothetical protein